MKLSIPSSPLGLIVLMSSLPRPTASSLKDSKEEVQLVPSVHSLRSVLLNRIRPERHLASDLKVSCETFVEYWMDGGPIPVGCTCQDLGNTVGYKFQCPNCFTCDDDMKFCVHDTVAFIYTTQDQTMNYQEVYAYNGSRTEIVTVNQPDVLDRNIQSSFCSVEVNNQSCNECKILYSCNGVGVPGTAFVNCSNIEADALFDGCEDPHWYLNIPKTSIFSALSYTFYDYMCLQTESDSNVSDNSPPPVDDSNASYPGISRPPNTTTDENSMARGRIVGILPLAYYLSLISIAIAFT